MLNISVKQRALLLLALFMGLFQAALYAQTARMKGTVLNEKGQPLSSVTVTAHTGSLPDVSTQTDSSGMFSFGNLVFGKKYDFQFSYVGYESYMEKDMPITSKLGNLLVHMKERTTQLNDVVVTALGFKRSERSLGYATQQISGAALQTVKGVDVGTSMTGMASGLAIFNSTEFNVAPTVNLRGETPLLVINGIPYGNMTLRDVPTDDIENINVLKGATGSALYGSRGAAGAIMITTKRGKGKGLSIDFNTNNLATLGYIAIDKPQTSYGHGIDGKISTDYVWGPKLDIGDSALQWDPASKTTEMMPLVSIGKNNLKNFMQTGVLSNNNISVTQSGENGFFRAGLNYIYNKGEWPNSTLKIINYTMSGQLKSGKKFDLESQMGYTRQTSPQNWSGQNQGYIYQLVYWTGPDYDIRKYKDYWIVPNQSQNWLYNQFYDNPYLIAHEKLMSTTQNKINASLTANYKFTNDLKLMFRSGYDYYNNELTVRSPAGINSTRAISVGSFSWNWSNAGLYGQNETWGYSTNNDLILTYAKKTGKFEFDGLAGGSIYYYTDREFGAQTANGLNVPGWYSLANAIPSTSAGSNSIINNFNTSSRQVNSAYAKLGFAYDNGIYLDLTGRNDWSSTQPSTQRSYFYPSASLSFILSQYLKLPDWVDTWKLRGSWTIDKIPAGIYQTSRSYGSGTSFGLVSTSYPGNLLGSDLKPSAARTWEFGTAAYLLNKRLHVDVAYFSKNYYNQQTSVSISNASGFNSTLINTKETYARRGLEVSLDATLVQHKHFTWNSMVNYSFDHRYYVHLDPVYSADNLWTKKGARLDAMTINNQWLRDPDGNIINSGGLPAQSSYLSKIGYSDPDFSFGFINNFRIGNFLCGINIDGRIGGLMNDVVYNDMYAAGSNPETDNQYRYDQVVKGLNNFISPGVKVVSGTATYDKYGNITSDTRTYAKNDVQVGYQSYARYIAGKGGNGRMNQSFVKLRQVSIGYSLSKNLLRNSGLKEASVSITGQNLLLVTGFKFSDPDVGTENLNAPSQRMVGLDIKLGL